MWLPLSTLHVALPVLPSMGGGGRAKSARTTSWYLELAVALGGVSRGPGEAITLSEGLEDPADGPGTSSSPPGPPGPS